MLALAPDDTAAQSRLAAAQARLAEADREQQAAARYAEACALDDAGKLDEALAAFQQLRQEYGAFRDVDARIAAAHAAVRRRLR